MKKLLLLLLPAILFVSCSKDDDSSDPVTPETILLRESVTHTAAGDVTTYYNYNGRLLTSTFDSNGNYKNYSYDGYLISEIESYLSTGVLNAVETFNYDTNGRLIISKVIAGNTGTRYTYEHNADGSISFTTFTGTATAQTTQDNTGKLFFENGEVSSMETYYSAGTVTNVYQYDDKRKPTENTFGFDKIAYSISNVRGRKGILRNVTSDIQTSTIDEVTHTTTRAYTYNSGGFPLVVDSNSSLPFEEYETDFLYE